MPARTITSVHNPRVKDAVHLRSGRHRAKQGRFLIDGARELSRAIDAGVPLVELFVCPELCSSAESQEVLAKLGTLQADIWEVPPVVFHKLAFGDREDGVVAVAATPDVSLATLQPRGLNLIAVLEAVEKPGNVGAVLRSADGAGVSAVIAANPQTDLFNPSCIRASLGTIFSQPVCRATTDETLVWLRQRGTKIYAAHLGATRDYSEVDLSGNVAVVLGNEAEGLSSAWQQADVEPIKLPMLGVADSLNVSATSAVLFYEALRQRMRAKRG